MSALLTLHQTRYLTSILTLRRMEAAGLVHRSELQGVWPHEVHHTLTTAALDCSVRSRRRSRGASTTSPLVTQNQVVEQGPYRRGR